MRKTTKENISHDGHYYIYATIGSLEKAFHTVQKSFLAILEFPKENKKHNLLVFGKWGRKTKDMETSTLYHIYILKIIEI